ncbi:putative RNA recognition motif domain, nucleotide-binding alpha-beta plait domain superfamily [Helianthus anomalus]
MAGGGRPTDKRWNDVVGLNRRGAVRDQVEVLLTKLFVTNLPEICSRKEVLEVFNHLGEVAGVYLARKRDKNGKNFGFISFRNVKDRKELLENCKGLRMGDFKLHINIVRFAVENKFEHIEQNQKHQEKKEGNQNIRQPPQNFGTGLERARTEGFTYCDALTNLKRPLTEKVHSEVKTIEKMASTEWRLCTWGGFLTIIAFDDQEPADLFLEDEGRWRRWFTSLDRWQGQSLAFERIAWLKVTGVPFHLAENSVFNSIGEKFGRVIHKAQVQWNEGNFSSFCLGVLSGEGERINEAVKLNWKNKSFMAWVDEEMSEWVSDCVGRVDSKNCDDFHDKSAPNQDGEEGTKFNHMSMEDNVEDLLHLDKENRTCGDAGVSDVSMDAGDQPVMVQLVGDGVKMGAESSGFVGVNGEASHRDQNEAGGSGFSKEREKVYFFRSVEDEGNKHVRKVRIKKEGWKPGESIFVSGSKKA